VCNAINPIVAQTFDYAPEAFRQAGIVKIIDAAEESAASAFWFINFDLELADAVDHKFEAKFNSIHPEPYQNITTAYTAALDDVCDPFRVRLE